MRCATCCLRPAGFSLQSSWWLACWVGYRYGVERWQHTTDHLFGSNSQGCVAIRFAVSGQVGITGCTWSWWISPELELSYCLLESTPPISEWFEFWSKPASNYWRKQLEVHAKATCILMVLVVQVFAEGESATGEGGSETALQKLLCSTRVRSIAVVIMMLE